MIAPRMRRRDQEAVKPTERLFRLTWSVGSLPDVVEHFYLLQRADRITELSTAAATLKQRFTYRSETLLCTIAEESGGGSEVAK